MVGLGLVWFSAGKSVFGQYLLDTRAADHCTLASYHLADAKSLEWMVPEWIQLHHSLSSNQLAEISPWAPACADDLLLSMGTPLHRACSSALSVLTAFKTISDTIGKVLGTPASSRPGKPSK